MKVVAGPAVLEGRHAMTHDVEEAPRSASAPNLVGHPLMTRPVARIEERGHVDDRERVDGRGHSSSSTNSFNRFQIGAIASTLVRPHRTTIVSLSGAMRIRWPSYPLAMNQLELGRSHQCAP